MNISTLVKKHASIQPHTQAVIAGDNGTAFSWLELDKVINKLGNALVALGIKKGDVVSVYLPNSPEFLFVYFATTRIGAIILPFNVLFKTGEISYILKNSRAKVLIGTSTEVEKNLIKVKDQFPHLETIITMGQPVTGCLDFDSLLIESSENLEIIDCNPEDLATLVYTSGTSGHPKGAMLSHSNLEAIGTLSSLALLINDKDLLLTGAPFCHICFVLSVLGPFHAGAGIVTMSRFSPDIALQLINHYQITHFSGVPTMFIYMLQQFDEQKYDLTSLRLVHCAGAPMPVAYITEIEQKFRVNFCELYGATETSSVISYNRLGHGRNGSIGQPAYGIQIKVVNESGHELQPGETGEFLVKGPGIFRGYWEMPEATEAAFDGEWYRTGDLGKYDKDGYLYIVDRLKDMIVCGGYNVYPRELEDIIYQNPKILEAAVLGHKDPMKNEVPKAYIALKENEKMTEEELIDFCKERMASYKVPHIIEFLPELPKSPSGKILKRALKQTVSKARDIYCFEG
ncbi:MAG TPA: long-chain-fatty-acid--CoA ligase [Syntrophomonadaceae bacterium]|nr:long-chain-fatty-acid--CoA ligase [Syntrophomonadaceae bacterium]